MYIILEIFFFLKSNKDVYSRTLPYAKKHKAEKGYRERKEKRTKKKRKEKEATNYKGES